MQSVHAASAGWNANPQASQFCMHAIFQVLRADAACLACAGGYTLVRPSVRPWAGVGGVSGMQPVDTQEIHEAENFPPDALVERRLHDRGAGRLFQHGQPRQAGF